MNFLDRLNIYLYHKNRSEEWPDRPDKILGWRDEKSQQSRFDVIAKQANFNNKSVLDLGCGYGDLKPYLDQFYNIASYTGIEQLQFLLKTAQDRQLEKCQFIHADFAQCTLPVHDIVVASGSLNYRSSQPNYLGQMIHRMYLAANEVVIFNLLNAKTFAEDKLLVAFDPEYVLDCCQQLCPNSYLIENTNDSNFTLVLKKQLEG